MRAESSSGAAMPGAQVTVELGVPVLPVRHVRLGRGGAVTGQLRCEHVVAACGERVSQGADFPRRAGEAVQEHKRRPAASEFDVDVIALTHLEAGHSQPHPASAAFAQQDIIGLRRSPGRHDIDRNPGLAKARTRRGGKRPGVAAGADQKQIKTARLGEHLPQRGFVQLAFTGNWPGPDAVRQTQQRAAMRHAAEAETAIAIRLDRRRARQMRGRCLRIHC